MVNLKFDLNEIEEIQPVLLEERSFRNQHTAAFVLFTGLPGAGKTTLARGAERLLFNRGIQVGVLDGDLVRAGLSHDLGFDTSARQENQRRLMEVGRLFLSTGMVILVSSISPLAKARAEMRSLVMPIPFLEVFVRCPLEVCEQRDPKGLYMKARHGTVQHVTGISDRYEEPTHPDLTVDTHKLSMGACCVEVVKRIMEVILIDAEGQSGDRSGV